MSFSEQADSSAERTTKLNIYSRLHTERSLAGSTLNYVTQLGQRYQDDPLHKPNLFQLQRMAIAITNPMNEPSFPSDLTNHFYWGQILAYRAQAMLGEEGWAADAYPLFSHAMHEHTEMAELYFEEPEWDEETGKDRALERSYLEIVKGKADMILGSIEDDESEFMPPAMQELIIAMTDELSETPENRWYMMLGFRHITMSVVEAAVNGTLRRDAAKAAEDEQLRLADDIKKEMKARRRLEKQFIRMMDKNEIDDIQGRELVAIDSVRERIMESYADHMIAYGAYDPEDEDVIDKLGMFLTQTMNKDFAELEDIEAEDFLEASGDVVFILYNEVSASRTLYMLGKGELLKGSVEAVAVVETPSVQAMLRLQERTVQADDLSEETNPVGVVLMLKDPVIVNSDGEHIQMGEGIVAGVVMSNPNMALSKHLL